MKVLYANPIFLDYRLPFYKRLNELFKGDFYVLYSTKRYKGRYDKLLEKIPQIMGENALPFNNEYLFNTYEKSFKRINKEKGKNIPFTLGLLKRIRNVNPDILITEGFYQWTPLIIIYSVLHHKPVFMGYERTCHTERNTSYIKKLYRKFINVFITGYLVNGSETTKYLLSLGIKKSKIHIGGMSADSKGLVNAIKNFSNKEKDDFKKHYKHNNGLIYLYTGQIVVRKGISYLLHAWLQHTNKYPNDTLVLVGYGDLFQTFKEQYGNNPTIFLEGKVDYDNVYKYYAIADAFIIPTTEDNWSLVVPEAMACGLPIATSIYNGCYPELVKKDVNGIIFDTFKQESIIEALEYFHHINLNEFGHNSIELEKKFNTENCAQREYEAIISHI